MKKQLVITIFMALFCALAANAEPMTHAVNEQGSVPDLDCVIEPSEIVDVGSPVPGVVEKIHAERSDLVEAGAVVVELESSVEQAAHNLARARSVLNTAIKLRQEGAAFGALTQERNQALMKTSAISKHNLDQVKSEAKIAKLQVQQERDNKRIAGLEAVRAKAMLDRRVIRTPVEGVVMERFKSVGEYIDDEPALRIAKLDPLHVEVIVPVEYLGQIQPGMQAKVLATAGSREKRIATVERVDRVADAASGTYGVRLTLPNPDYQVTAGLRCKVDFLPGQKIIPVSDDARVTQSVPDEPAPVKESEPKTVPAAMKKAAMADTESGAFVKVSSKPAKTCYSIGPVKDERTAKKLSTKLEGKTQDLKMRNEDAMVTKDYVVMTPAAPGKKDIDELLQKISAVGITDRFVFDKGPYKGRVSVGTYYYKQSAVKRKELITSHGIRAEIVPRKKNATQYWLDLELQPGADESAKLETVRKSYAPSVPLNQVACS